MAKIIAVDWSQKWFFSNLDLVKQKITEEIRKYDLSHPNLNGLDEVMLDLPGDWESNNRFYEEKGLFNEQIHLARMLESSGVYVLPGDLGFHFTVPKNYNFLKQAMWSLMGIGQEERREACLDEYQSKRPELALFEPSLAAYVHSHGPDSRGVEFEKFYPIRNYPANMDPRDHTGVLAKHLF